MEHVALYHFVTATLSYTCIGTLEQVFDTSQFTDADTLTITAVDIQGEIARYTYTFGMRAKMLHAYVAA